MGDKTGIEWTSHTFNPWWGCARVSLGCNNCYADDVATRWGHDELWRAHGPRRMMADAYWRNPIKWNRQAESEGVPARVFCASMADVFEAHPEPDVRAQQDAARARLWDVIERTPWLHWQLLTKRPERVEGMVPWGDAWPSNVWLGTSVENQQFADVRIPQLLRIPAKVRFLSCEPLLGPVDLTKWTDAPPVCGCLAPEPSGIDWVIVGGESGHDARPMHPDWARSLRDQCAALGVPMLFKQWGVWVPYELDAQPPFWVSQSGDSIDGHCLPATLSDGEPVSGWWAPDPTDSVIYRRVGRKAAGRELDGRTHDEYPQPLAPAVDGTR